MTRIRVLQKIICFGAYRSESKMNNHPLGKRVNLRKPFRMRNDRWIISILHVSIWMKRYHYTRPQTRPQMRAAIGWARVRRQAQETLHPFTGREDATSSHLERQIRREAGDRCEKMGKLIRVATSSTQRHTIIFALLPAAMGALLSECSSDTGEQRSKRPPTRRETYKFAHIRYKVITARGYDEAAHVR